MIKIRCYKCDADVLVRKGALKVRCENCGAVIVLPQKRREVRVHGSRRAGSTG